MTLHRIEHSSYHGTLAILKCRQGYLKAFCQQSLEGCGELVEIQIDPEDNWHSGYFGNALINIQPMKWAVSIEEAAEGYKDCSGILWLNLARAGLTNAFDANALREGLLALEQLEKAKETYTEAMKSLGFEFLEDGSYEDYENWLSLSGLPIVRFPVEGRHD